MEVVRRCFQRHPMQGRPETYILRLLELTLQNNALTFDDEGYLQISGIRRCEKRTLQA